MAGEPSTTNTLNLIVTFSAAEVLGKPRRKGRKTRSGKESWYTHFCPGSC